MCQVSWGELRLIDGDAELSFDFLEARRNGESMAE
jgi:hypothetical protein